MRGAALSAGLIEGAGFGIRPHLDRRPIFLYNESAFCKRFHHLRNMAPHKSKRATINDVAELAGISISTVSRVINGTAVVSETTARKVLQAIESLHYRPQAAARILASRRTNTIGLLLPVISGEFFAEMLRGIERGVMEGGFGLLIHSTHLNPSSNDPFRHLLGEHNTDGIIAFSDSLDDREIARLHAIHFPVVLLHRSSPPGLNIPAVTVENKKGAREAVAHLIDFHAHRRIVFLRGPEKHEDSRWREAGYREALALHDIPFDPRLVGTGSFAAQDAETALRGLLAAGPAFDAVFAGDDDAASGVYLALQKAGKKIPEDVAVIGFDDSSLAEYLSPPLTTVQAHIEQAGYAAANQLVSLIKQGTADPITLLPTQLVVRQSCGCL